MKYFFFLIIIFNIFFNKITYCAESYVVFKVNNQIITNVDIDNEYRYLIALNKKLQKVDKNKPIIIYCSVGYRQLPCRHQPRRYS